MEQVEEDEKRHHEELQRYAEQHRAAWQVDVEERRRLDKMADEKAKFAAAITSRRSAEFEALKVRPLGCCLALCVLAKGVFVCARDVATFLQCSDSAVHVLSVFCQSKRSDMPSQQGFQ